MESTISQMEVVMETLIGKRAIGFWKLTEARLDGKRGGGREAALEYRQTLKGRGVITVPLCQ